MILLDASGLFAAISKQEPAHTKSRALLEADPGPLVLSPFTLAEVDYLVSRRSGVSSELRLLAEVASGKYRLVSFTPDDVEQATGVIDRYCDLNIGLADASIVVLAGKLGCDRVLTLDERHFRALRTPAGEPFVVLPAAS